MTNIMQYQTVGTLYGVASLRHNPNPLPVRFITHTGRPACWLHFTFLTENPVRRITIYSNCINVNVA